MTNIGVKKVIVEISFSIFFPNISAPKIQKIMSNMMTKPIKNNFEDSSSM